MNGENEQIKPHEITANKGFGLYTVACGACGYESDHHIGTTACCPSCGQVFCMGVLADLHMRREALRQEWNGGQ